MRSLAQACIDAGYPADGPALLKIARARMRARWKRETPRRFPDRRIVEADTLTERQLQARAYIAQWEQANNLRSAPVTFAEPEAVEIEEAIV